MTVLPRRGSHAGRPLRRLQGRRRVHPRCLQRGRCEAGLIRQRRGLRLDLRRGRAGHTAGLQHPLASDVRRHRARWHHRRQQRRRLQQGLAEPPRPVERHVAPVVPAEAGTQVTDRSRIPFSDTRPLRERPIPAYAGCMTVIPAAPIDCVYSSQHSYRYRLWLRRQLLKSLATLFIFRRKQAVACRTASQGGQGGQIEHAIYS